MVLSSVKLSMPGVPAVQQQNKSRTQSCNLGTISTSSRQTRSSSRPTVSAQDEDGACTRTIMAGQDQNPHSPTIQDVSCTTTTTNLRPKSLRIKLSIKEIMSRNTEPESSKKNRASRLVVSPTSTSASYSRMTRDLHDNASSIPTSDHARNDDYRALIEQHMKQSPECSSVWICQNCGAQRKQGKRHGASLSILLSHLRTCLKSNDIVEEYFDKQVPNPPVTEKPSNKAMDDVTDSSTPGTLQPNMAVDVCFGAHASHGYRLFQDAVKTVRMSVHENDWEDVAVAQTLEGFRCQNQHPEARFLIKSGANGWREASVEEVRKKILAMYRHYFSFKVHKEKAIVQHPVSERNDEVPFFLRQLELTNCHAHVEETSGHSGTNLDAGIIRHVLIETEDRPLHNQVATRSNTLRTKRGMESDLSMSSSSNTDARAKRAKYNDKLTTAAALSASDSSTTDDDGSNESLWALNVYQVVRNKINAKWYTREQERHQRAVQLEQQIQELRSNEKEIVEKKELIQSARRQFAELATNAGVDVDCLMLEKDASAACDLSKSDESEWESGEDETLALRIQRRLRRLKAESTELDRMIHWWHQQTTELEKLLHTEHEPTNEFLRADARLSELESQAEKLLQSSL